MSDADKDKDAEILRLYDNLCDLEQSAEATNSATEATQVWSEVWEKPQ